MPMTEEQLATLAKISIDGELGCHSIDQFCQTYPDITEEEGYRGQVIRMHMMEEKGYRVVGKTGTAEIASDTGGYKKGMYNISFIGYLPDTSTNLVCFVGATDVPGERKTVGTFRDIMAFAIDRYNITQN